jgi:hypothetical protein
LFARKLLQLALGGIEGVADGDVNIVVGVDVARGPADNQFGPWNPDLDPDVEDVAFLMLFVRKPHGDTAAVDAVVIPVELIDALPNARFDELRRLNILKVDFERNVHEILPRKQS